MKPVILTPEKAAELVVDGVTIATATVGLAGCAESVVKCIEKNFLETGHPKGLTLMHGAGSHGPNKTGSVHFCHEVMTKRYIVAHWGRAAEWVELIDSNKIECYCFSQGTIVHMFRSNASGQPGHISKSGIGTFIDPRQEGGKMNQLTRDNGEDLVELIKIAGEEYILYKAIPIDIALIRGTYADEDGNITMDEEAVRLEVMPVVLACKRHGGKVICQVKQIVKNGCLNPRSVVVPGNFIDVLVECPSPEKEHRMTALQYYHPAYIGKIRLTEDKLPGIPVPMSIRKVIGRRAAMEAYRGALCNVGVGIPYDTVSKILYEEGIRKDITFTVETGVYGGVLPHADDFGASFNFDSMLDHQTQFDFYNGVGVSIAFMGVGEVDQNGNCNASKMGEKITGCGGFVDITQNAKKTVFCTTFTAKGLDVTWDMQNGIRIIKEGSIKKFVKKLDQITYNADFARDAGHEMIIVTERAVFVLTKTGIKLIEIAKGIDLQKDILDQMGFIPEISENLKEIDSIIYSNGLIGLKEKLGCSE